MKKIYQQKHIVFYNHISLYDTEDINSYPIATKGRFWEIEFFSKGVKVPAINDEEIKITIYHSDRKNEDSIYVPGIIEVGKRGITIGNEGVGDIESKITFPSGKVEVSVCTDFPTEYSMTISFKLFRLENNINI